MRFPFWKESVPTGRNKIINDPQLRTVHSVRSSENAACVIIKMTAAGERLYVLIVFITVRLYASKFSQRFKRVRKFQFSENIRSDC